MKRIWTEKELVDNFSILPLELELMKSKRGKDKLGFAVMLKYFAHELQFPKNRSNIPVKVINFIAKQLLIDPLKINTYQFSSRNTTRHRSEIKEFFNFRDISVQDADVIRDWMIEDEECYDECAKQS